MGAIWRSESARSCKRAKPVFERTNEKLIRIWFVAGVQHGFPNDRPLTPEDIVKQWKKITNFSECWLFEFFFGLLELTSRFSSCRGRSIHSPFLHLRGSSAGSFPSHVPPSTLLLRPSDFSQHFLLPVSQIIENFDNKASTSSSDDSEDPQIVKDAKANVPAPDEFTYSERDVILYALGVGATEKDLKWVYEQDDAFSVSRAHSPFPSLAGLLVLRSFERRRLPTL